MKPKLFPRFLIFLLFFLAVATVFAAAGGAGGGHSGGGGDSGGDGGAIIYLIYWIIRLIFMLPFPINIIVLAIVIFVIYKVSKSYQATSGLNSIPNFSTVNNDIYNKPETLPTTFQTKNPDFNANNFKQKVQTAFVAIQNAWMLQDISKVRKWITDGVYQRFNTQFIMMKAIEQVNEISDINIQQIYIDDVEEDGEYDIIHVGIQYSMYDGFSSKKFKRLNDGGTLHALEYWSFIKK